jgi:hypothetical protein
MGYNTHLHRCQVHRIVPALCSELKSFPPFCQWPETARQVRLTAESREWQNLSVDVEVRVDQEIMISVVLANRDGHVPGSRMVGKDITAPKPIHIDTKGFSR